MRTPRRALRCRLSLATVIRSSHTRVATDLGLLLLDRECARRASNERRWKVSRWITTAELMFQPQSVAEFRGRG